MIRIIRRSIIFIQQFGCSRFTSSLWKQLYVKSFFPRSTLFGWFGNKTGIEIGGPSKMFEKTGMFPVYCIADAIDNCNFNSSTPWNVQLLPGHSFCFNKDKPPGNQYILDASHLTDIPSGKYDFLISSHCLEHVANPIRALKEWLRIIRPQGIIAIVLPHKALTFDHKRPDTTLQHLIDDFERDVSESDLTHLDETLRLHDIRFDPGLISCLQLKERCSNNLETRYLHHHVFTEKLATELFDYLDVDILQVAVFFPYHLVLIGKKRPS
jgi:SAM-dependent methyltransferase